MNSSGRGASSYWFGGNNGCLVSKVSLSGCTILSIPGGRLYIGSIGLVSSRASGNKCKQWLTHWGKWVGLIRVGFYQLTRGQLEHHHTINICEAIHSKRFGFPVFTQCSFRASPNVFLKMASVNTSFSLKVCLSDIITLILISNI